MRPLAFNVLVVLLVASVAWGDPLPRAPASLPSPLPSPVHADFPDLTSNGHDALLQRLHSVPPLAERVHASLPRTVSHVRTVPPVQRHLTSSTLDLQWLSAPTVNMLPTHAQEMALGTTHTCQLPALAVRATGAAVTAGATVLCSASVEALSSSSVPVAFVGTTVVVAAPSDGVARFSSMGITGDPRTGVLVYVTIACNASQTATTARTVASIAEYGEIAKVEVQLPPAAYNFPPAALQLGERLPAGYLRIMANCISTHPDCAVVPLEGVPLTSSRIQASELQVQQYLVHPSEPGADTFNYVWESLDLATFDDPSNGIVEVRGAEVLSAGYANFHDADGVMVSPLVFRMYVFPKFRGHALGAFFALVSLRNMTLTWASPPPLAVLLAAGVSSLPGSFPTLALQLVDSGGSGGHAQPAAVDVAMFEAYTCTLVCDPMATVALEDAGTLFAPVTCSARETRMSPSGAITFEADTWSADAPPGSFLHFAVECVDSALIAPTRRIRARTATAYYQPVWEAALVLSPDTGDAVDVDLGMYNSTLYDADAWLQQRDFVRMTDRLPFAWPEGLQNLTRDAVRMDAEQYATLFGPTLHVAVGATHYMAARMLVFVPRTRDDALTDYVPLVKRGAWTLQSSADMRCDTQHYAPSQTRLPLRYNDVFWPAHNSSLAWAGKAPTLGFTMAMGITTPTASIGADASIIVSLNGVVAEPSMQPFDTSVRISCIPARYIAKPQILNTHIAAYTWMSRSQALPLSVHRVVSGPLKGQICALRITNPTQNTVRCLLFVDAQIFLRPFAIPFPIRYELAYWMASYESPYDPLVPKPAFVIAKSAQEEGRGFLLEVSLTSATLVRSGYFSLETGVHHQQPNSASSVLVSTLLALPFTVVDYRLTLVSAFPPSGNLTACMPDVALTLGWSWMLRQPDPTLENGTYSYEAARQVAFYNVSVYAVSRAAFLFHISSLDVTAKVSQVANYPGVWPQVPVIPPATTLLAPTFMCQLFAIQPTRLLLGSSAFTNDTVLLADALPVTNSARTTLVSAECTMNGAPLVSSPSIRVRHQPVSLRSNVTLPPFIPGAQVGSVDDPLSLQIVARLVDATDQTRPVTDVRPGIRCSLQANAAAATMDVNQLRVHDDVPVDDGELVDVPVGGGGHGIAGALVGVSGTTEVLYDTGLGGAFFDELVIAAPPATTVQLSVACRDETAPPESPPFVVTTLGTTRTYDVIVRLEQPASAEGAQTAQPAVHNIAGYTKTRVVAHLLAQNSSGQFAPYNASRMGIATCAITGNTTLTGQASDLQVVVAGPGPDAARLVFYASVEADAFSTIAVHVTCARAGYSTSSTAPLLLRIIPAVAEWLPPLPAHIVLPSTLLALQPVRPAARLALRSAQPLAPFASMPLFGAQCAPSAWSVNASSVLDASLRAALTTAPVLDALSTAQRAAVCRASEEAGDDVVEVPVHTLPDSVRTSVVRRGSLLASPLLVSWNATTAAIQLEPLHVTSEWGSTLCIRAACVRREGDAVHAPLYLLLRVPRLSMRWGARPPTFLAAGDASLLPFSVEVFDAAMRDGASRTPLFIDDRAPIVCQAYIHINMSAVNASTEGSVVIVSGSVARVQGGSAHFPYFSLVLGRLFTAFDMRVSCALGDQPLQNSLAWRLHTEGCAAGWQPSADWRSCEECPAGTWSDPNAMRCLPCPRMGASCSGGTLRLLPGFFFVPRPLPTQFVDTVVNTRPLSAYTGNGTDDATVDGITTASSTSSSDSSQHAAGGGIAARLLTGTTLVAASNSSVHVLLRAGAYELHACPTPDVCLVNATSGAYTCADGYTGPLCNTCDHDHGYVQSDTACTPCASTGVNAFVFALIVIALLLLLLYASRTGNAQRSNAAIAWRILITYVSTLAVVSRYNSAQGSVFSAFASIAQTVLIPFTASSTSAAVSPLQCIMRLNFFGRFYMSLLMPFLAVAAYVIIDPGLKACLVRIRTRSASAAAAVAAVFWHTYKLLAVLLLVSFMAYPSIIDAAVRALDCLPEAVNGVHYLRVDSSVACGSSAHKAASVLAVATVVVYCVCIPVGLCAWLAWHAQVIRADAFASSAAPPQQAVPRIEPDPAGRNAANALASASTPGTNVPRAGGRNSSSSRAPRVSIAARLSVLSMRAPVGQPSPFFSAFGFLYSGLRTDSALATSWEAVIMVRRACMVLISLAPTWLDQIAGSMAILILSLAAQVLVAPYAQPLFNYLELATLLVLCAGQCLLALASCATPLSTVSTVELNEPTTCSMSPQIALVLLIVLHVLMMFVLFAVFAWFRWQEWRAQKPAAIVKVQRVITRGAQRMMSTRRAGVADAKDAAANDAQDVDTVIAVPVRATPTPSVAATCSQAAAPHSNHHSPSPTSAINPLAANQVRGARPIPTHASAGADARRSGSAAFGARSRSTMALTLAAAHTQRATSTIASLPVVEGHPSTPPVVASPSSVLAAITPSTPATASHLPGLSAGARARILRPTMLPASHAPSAIQK